jgi:hypothetical protein
MNDSAINQLTMYRRSNVDKVWTFRLLIAVVEARLDTKQICT